MSQSRVSDSQQKSAPLQASADGLTSATTRSAFASQEGHCRYLSPQLNSLPHTHDDLRTDDTRIRLRAVLTEQISSSKTPATRYPRRDSSCNSRSLEAPPILFRVKPSEGIGNGSRWRWNHDAFDVVFSFVEFDLLVQFPGGYPTWYITPGSKHVVTMGLEELLSVSPEQFAWTKLSKEF